MVCVGTDWEESLCSADQCSGFRGLKINDVIQHRFVRFVCRVFTVSKYDEHGLILYRFQSSLCFCLRGRVARENSITENHIQNVQMTAVSEGNQAEQCIIQNVHKIADSEGNPVV